MRGRATYATTHWSVCYLQVVFFYRLTLDFANAANSVQPLAVNSKKCAPWPSICFAVRRSVRANAWRGWRSALAALSG
jgi:hypothetical protein